MEIPEDRNVKQKEAEKKLKYNSLCIEYNECGTITGDTGIGKKSFKNIFGSHTRKTFNRFTTKESSTWNITHNTESAAV